MSGKSQRRQEKRERQKRREEQFCWWAFLARRVAISPGPQNRGTHQRLWHEWCWRGRPSMRTHP